MRALTGLIVVSLGCGSMGPSRDGGSAGGFVTGGGFQTAGGASAGGLAGGTAGGTSNAGGAAGGSGGGSAGGTSLDGGVDGGVPSLPAWRLGARKWEWLELRGSSLYALSVTNPVTGATVHPASRLESFTGVAVDRTTNRLYLAGAGDPNDWAGNEAYELDLSADQPRWRLLRESTLGSSLIPGAAYNADGRPAASRIYSSLYFVRARGRIFRLAAAWVWGGTPGGFSTVDAFDLAANDWDPAGTYPSGAPHGDTVDRPAAQHPLTDDVYTYFQGSFRKWSAATATWSVLAPKPNGASDTAVLGSPAAVDPVREQVLFTRFVSPMSNTQGLRLSLGASPSTTEVAFTGPGAHLIRDHCGMDFVPSEDAFFVKAELTSQVYRVDPTTFETTVQQTTGALPATAVNGIYTRWVYLPALKGIVFVPNGTANAFFLATE